MSHHRSRRRHVVTKGGLTLPRAGLLLSIPLPNAYLPIDWDEEIGWESPMRGYQATPGDDALFAAAPQLYDGDVDSPLILSDTEILALSGINTTVNGVEVSFSLTDGLSVKWHRIAYIPNAYPFIDRDGVSSLAPQPGRGYLGDGMGYITISGLLVTDTITSESEDQPTCTTAGRLDIANGDFVYGITIKRTGETIAFYACTEGYGATCINSHHGLTTLSDGVISSATLHYTTRDGSGFDLNTLGYRINRDDGLKIGSNGTDRYIYGDKQYVVRPGAGAQLGPELGNNPNFASWVNSSTPTGWSKPFTATADRYVVESNADGVPTTGGGHCRLVSNDGGYVALFRNMLVRGRWHVVEIEIAKITVGSLQIVAGTAPGSEVIEGILVGKTKFEFFLPYNLGYTELNIIRKGITDCVIKSISLKVGIPTLLDNTIDDDIRISFWGDSLVSWSAYYLSTKVGRFLNFRGVSGETSTQIKTRMMAEISTHDDISIFWEGRNNFSSLSTVLADIASQVSVLSSDKYIVLSVINGTGEPTGSLGYTQIEALNAALSSTYGDKYLDVRTLLVNSYNQDIPQDVIDHDGDIPPSSLRIDGIHLNYSGNWIVANAVYNKLVELQYSIDVSVLGVATHAGAVKQNITRTSGTSATLADGDEYTLPDSHTFRTAVGWTYGVDHWGYNADGTPKTVLGSVIKENGDGLRWYVGAKGMALFSVDQTEKDAKIKKYLKVPA